MRRLTPVTSKVEVLLLESPEAFEAALLARPPHAEQNHLIARDRGESLRRFAMRVLHRIRRLARAPGQIISSISYLFSGDPAEAKVRGRLLSALMLMQARRGALRLIGPQQATGRLFDYMDALSPRLPAGTRLESGLSPTGWTIMSARPRRDEAANAVS